MAKASIVYKEASPASSNNIIRFIYNVKAGYTIHNDTSIRMYYTPTEGATPTSGSSCITLDLTSNKCLSKEYVSGEGYLITYRINISDVNNYTSITAQLRMKIYGVNSTYESKYASYKTITFPLKFEDIDTQSLFRIASYYNYHLVTDDEEEHYVWDKKFINFTNFIELPSYDVNYKDVNEDWEDANYFTHRIRVRQKINGKFNLRFSDIKSYNEFIDLIKKSKERNGHGKAYVELQLQINDDLDEYSAETVGEKRCSIVTSLFFVELGSNPWVAPIFGHYDKYQAISLTVTEA